ncbi:hypothetical protein T440DRAFT_453518 [Plenodomus tracheiphilus IPT5]|uniref:Uncharacterized protein n=1 Tax=Plenodomus tracheiphilus IPT5 TaxID=1408161 RepID=A0A6A7B0X0_9PLEO|nr:hypothetical protein T440DRAFT_453518 [Plenodomus tracheiphilus IPT5]
MLRPYFHFPSKTGAMPRRDTNIKSHDVAQAIQQYADARKDTRFAYPVRNQEGYSFLDLPGEVRNRIYEFTLNSGTKEDPRIWVPKSGHSSAPHDPASNLFRLCKTISYEARTLMEARDNYYIPIMPAMDFSVLVANTIKYGSRSSTPTQSTIMHSLTMAKNVHIHLHVNYRPNPDPDDDEPFLDPLMCNILGRLRQALIMFINGSELTASSAEIMGRDKSTQWELKYYVYTSEAERNDYWWAEMDESLSAQHASHQKLCSRFTNVKLTAEVYGERIWSLEGKCKDVTRNITPSSILWPSWPNHVPWRTHPRVDAVSASSPEKVELSERVRSSSVQPHDEDPSDSATESLHEWLLARLRDR